MGQQGLNDFKYPQLTKFDNFDNGINNNNNNNNNINNNNNNNNNNSGQTGDTNKDPSKQFQTSGNFDLQKFNKAFEQNKVQTSQINSSLESQRLAKLNSLAPPLKPYQLSFSEILIGIKDSWFELIDELLQSQFYMETFTKKNRMFYIGLTIVIIIIIIYLYDIILGSMDNEIPITQKKIIEHHYYHHTSEIKSANIPAIEKPVIEKAEIEPVTKPEI